MGNTMIPRGTLQSTTTKFKSGSKLHQSTRKKRMLLKRNIPCVISTTSQNKEPVCGAQQLGIFIYLFIYLLTITCSYLLFCYCSGGVKRDWVGLPRSLYSAESNSVRCACVQESELDDPLLKVYEGCPEDSITCNIPK